MLLSSLLLLQTAPLGSDSLAPWLTSLISLGGFGLLLVLLLIGRLVPKSAHDEMRADRDAYKQAFETLRADKQAQVDRDQVLLRFLEEIKDAQRNRTP